MQTPKADSSHKVETDSASGISPVPDPSTAVDLDKTLIKGRRSAVPKQSDQAARIPLKNLENPQSYSIVTRNALEKQGITSYTSALRLVPGIVSEGSKPGVRSWPYLRGFQDQAFFRNGKMLGSWTEVDIANIERIEVLKGPSGALFGGHGRTSYGGVINRVTKKPESDFGGEAALIAGSNGYNRMTVDVNAPVDKEGRVLSRVNAAYRKEDADQDYGWGESFFFAPVLTYQVSDRFKLLLESEFFKFEGAASGISAGAGVTNLNQLLPIHRASFLTDEIANNHQTVYFNADAVYELGHGWNSTTTYGFSHSDYNYYGISASADLVKNTVERTAGSYVYDINFTNLQQNFNGDFKLGFVRNRIVIGLDYLRDEELYSGVGARLPSIPFGPQAPYVNRMYIDSVLANVPTSPGGSRDQRYSGYVSDVISPLENLHLMASIRYERAILESPSTTNPGSYREDTRFSQGAWTPKVGVVYEIMKDRLSVYANYMGSRKNLYKIRVNDGTVEGKEVKADPEEANQVEGGLKVDLFGDRLVGTASVFDIVVDNKVRTDPANTRFSIQDGTQEHKGFELDLFASPLSGIELSGGYAYLHAEFLNGTTKGNEVPNAPEQSVKYWISYQVKGGVMHGIGLGGGGDYRGRGFTNAANTITLPSAHVLGASVSYTQPRYRLDLTADNLNDDSYWGVTGQALPRRTFKGSASIRF